MDIVFINQSAGYLMVDIINEFRHLCDKRILITGELYQRNIKLDNDVLIEKITPYKRKNKLTRSFSWILAFLQIFFILKIRYRKAHVFFVTNPPLVQFLPALIRNEFSFLVFDIYPDTLFKYKFLNPESLLGTYWIKNNRFAFNKAYRVYTISDEMKKVLNNYSNRNDIHVVPIWSDGSDFDLVTKNDNPFLSANKLENKFIVLYSGNLGISYNVEILVEVAKLVTHPDIFFLIIGNGEKFKLIEKLIDKYHLNNCRILPLQPVEMLPYTIGNAGLGVVSCSSDSSNLSLPSKAFSFIAAGKPLLCISDKESELSRLIEGFNIGESFYSTQVKEMAEFIFKVFSNKQIMDNFRFNLSILKSNFGRDNSKRFPEIFFNKSSKIALNQVDN